jgi:hypothetical protein
MPLERPEQQGTRANGEKSDDYCTFCYRDGHFTDPNLTKEQMITRATEFLVSLHQMPEPAAATLARRLVSGLKRWLDGAAA